MQLILSLEDTNKIRQQIGLKSIPLETSSSHSDELRKRAQNVIVRSGLGPKSKESTINRLENLSGSNSTPENVQPTEKAVNTEPTISWIHRMRAMAANSTKDNNNAPAVESEADQPEVSQKASDEPIENMCRSLKRCYSPDANVFDDTGVKPTTTHLPLQHSYKKEKEKAKPEKITFRPKKSKTIAPVRKRLNRDTLKSVIPGRPGIYSDKDVDLDKLIAITRRKHIEMHDTIPVRDQSEKKEASVRKAYTNAFKTLSKSSMVAKPTESSTTQESMNLNTDGTETKIINEAQPEEVSGNLETMRTDVGIANTLKRLKSRSAAPLTESSKLWARKLMESQKQREAEINMFANKNAHLPHKEQERALEVFKEQLVHEQSAEANEFSQNYRPCIDLDYRDSKGNLITSKQAFKQLSRAFHGGRR